MTPVLKHVSFCPSCSARMESRQEARFRGAGGGDWSVKRVRMEERESERHAMPCGWFVLECDRLEASKDSALAGAASPSTLVEVISDLNGS